MVYCTRIDKICSAYFERFTSRTKFVNFALPAY